MVPSCTLLSDIKPWLKNRKRTGISLCNFFSDDCEKNQNKNKKSRLTKLPDQEKGKVSMIIRPMSDFILIKKQTSTKHVTVIYLTYLR